MGDTLVTPAVSFPSQIVFYVDSSGSGAGHSASVDYNVNGGSWVSISTFVVSTTGSNFTFALTSAPDLTTSTNVRFRFNSSFSTWYLDDVRIHGLGCGGGGTPNTPPVLNPISNKTTLISNAISFAVTAVPTEGDTVTLSVSNAPAGSLFSTTNEDGSFSWATPAPVGVYTMTFYAADIGGVDSEQILLDVQAIGTGSGGTESFSNSTAPSATYGSGSYVGDNNVQWTYSFARTPDSTYQIDGRSMGFGSAPSVREVYSSTVPGGVGTLSLKYRKYFTGTGARSFDVYVNATPVGSVTVITNTAAQTLTLSNINVAGSVVIRVRGTGASQFVIDTLTWTGYPADDSNGNGIPDSWEMEYFGDLTNSAAGDNDGDGIDNIDEYCADTNPTNGASRFLVESILENGGSAVSFFGTNSRLYSVEYAPELRNELIWSNLSSVVAGSNGLMLVTDTNAAPQRMYRVRVKLP